MQQLQPDAVNFQSFIVLRDNPSGETIGGKSATAGCPRSFPLLFIVLLSGDLNAVRERGGTVNVISVAVRFNKSGNRLGSNFRDAGEQLLPTGHACLDFDDDHARSAYNDSAVPVAALDPVNVRA
jgi:hypothetical protein